MKKQEEQKQPLVTPGDRLLGLMIGLALVLVILVVMLLGGVP